MIDMPASLPAWLEQFDGTGLGAKTNVSALLATSAGDWPHIAYLSCGEVLAIAPDRLRLCLWPSSGSARNLQTAKRASLHVAAGGSVWEARLTALRIMVDDASIMAEMQLVETIKHRAPYAQVSAMIGFALTDPDKTLERWRAQIQRLRGFAG